MIASYAIHKYFYSIDAIIKDIYNLVNNFPAKLNDNRKIFYSAYFLARSI